MNGFVRFQQTFTPSNSKPGDGSATVGLSKYPKTVEALLAQKCMLTSVIGRGVTTSPVITTIQVIHLIIDGSLLWRNSNINYVLIIFSNNFMIQV